VAGADVPVATDLADATPAGIAGIDISRYQLKVNLEAAADAGIRFVFTKATQGTSVLDTWYARHVRDARNAGLFLGSYHFFDYRKDGVEQADWFVKAMRETGADMNVLPPVVDVECLASMGRANQGYARTQLRAFVDRVYQRTGRMVMVYTSRSMWDKVTGGDTSFGDHPLWVACWSCSSPHIPAGWTSWDFWQHGTRTIPDPQPGDPDRTRTVDGNVFRYASLTPWKSRPMVVAGDAAETTGGELPVQLRGVDGVLVRASTQESGGWGPWQTRDEASTVTLAGEPGMRTVRVQGRDARGTTGPIFRDTIRLLPSEPQVRVESLRITTDSVSPSGRIPLRAQWRLSGTLATVATRSVVVACDDRQVLSLSASLTGLSSTGSERASLRARPGERCEVVVRAQDADGATMASHTLRRTVRLLDDDASAIRYSSAWRRRSASGAYDGRTTTSTRAGSRARLTFTGDQVALLATTGPGRGRVRIAIDGHTVATVDLRASRTSMRRIVFARGIPAGTHTIEVRQVKRPNGKVGRVDIDGFLTTRP
jgi:GH25 family lysozyme M1 (1,4-beta-N-acetylmuramidase)